MNRLEGLAALGSALSAHEALQIAALWPNDDWEEFEVTLRNEDGPRDRKYVRLRTDGEVFRIGFDNGFECGEDAARDEDAWEIAHRYSALALAYLRGHGRIEEERVLRLWTRKVFRIEAGGERCILGASRGWVG